MQDICFFVMTIIVFPFELKMKIRKILALDTGAGNFVFDNVISPNQWS